MVQEAEEGTRSAYSVFRHLLLPFRQLLGLFLLLLLLLLLVSLGTVLIRRLGASACGWRCGFAAPNTDGPPTPADAILLFLSAVGAGL